MADADVKIRKAERPKYLILFEALLTGVITGLLIAVLRISITKSEGLRDVLLEKIQGRPGLTAAAVLLLAGLFIAECLILRAEPLSSSSGIPQIKAELMGEMRQRWYTVIPAKFFSTVISIGAGLSLGREGPSVQLGGMSGKFVSHMFKGGNTDVKMMISCGAGAGISCAFGAPLSGVIFVIEAMHGYFSTQIIIATMTSCLAGTFVTSNIFGLEPVFTFGLTKALPLRYYWVLVLMGAFAGVLGVLFNRSIVWAQDLYAHIKSKEARMAIAFAAVIPVAVFMPRILGSGSKIVPDITESDVAAEMLLLVLVLKFVLVMVSAGSGASGGTLQPLLVLGALAGALFYKTVAVRAGLDYAYLENFVMYGMIGYFSAIVRAPITGVLLITEMTGNFTNFFSMVVAALVAYLVAEGLHSEPVFDMLTDRMLNKSPDMESRGVTEEKAMEKVFVTSEVYIGSMMDGARVMDISLPEGCLIVSVKRGKKDVVPSGRTVIKGGDTISLICREGDAKALEDKLALECRHIVIDRGPDAS
jgi:H+/Cl- antiporter ClcA